MGYAKRRVFKRLKMFFLDILYSTLAHKTWSSWHVTWLKVYKEKANKQRPGQGNLFNFWPLSKRTKYSNILPRFCIFWDSGTNLVDQPIFELLPLTIISSISRKIWPQTQMILESSLFWVIYIKAYPWHLPMGKTISRAKSYK